MRFYETDGWPTTLMAVNAIGFLCEAADHHPDLTVSWGKLTVRLNTHTAGGVTDKDLELARRDRPARSLAPRRGVGPARHAPASSSGGAEIPLPALVEELPTPPVTGRRLRAAPRPPLSAPARELGPRDSAGTVFLPDRRPGPGLDHVTPPIPAMRCSRQREYVAARHAEPIPGLPPFQCGVAGFLGYEFGRRLERLPAPRTDDLGLPDAWLGAYDWVIAWDHGEGRAWVLAWRQAGKRGSGAVSRDERIRDIARAAAGSTATGAQSLATRACARHPSSNPGSLATSICGRWSGSGSTSSPATFSRPTCRSASRRRGPAIRSNSTGGSPR